MTTPCANAHPDDPDEADRSRDADRSGVAGWSDVDDRPDDPDEPVVRVHSPSGLWGCLPYLVGFQPERSLVLVFMGPRPRRVLLTLRLDLDIGDEPQGPHMLGDMLIGTVERARSHDVDIQLAHLIVVSDEADQLPYARLVEAAVTTLLACGLDVGEVFAGSADRMWCYEEGSTCPGHPVDTVDVEAARFALVTHGYGFVPSRSDLERALEPDTAGMLGESEWREACARRERALSRSSAAQRHWRRGEEEHLVAVLTGQIDEATISGDDVARWAVALAEARIREPVMFRVLVAPTGEQRRRFAASARAVLCAAAVRCPQSALAPVAATLAAVAWQQGDGAFARIAAERAQQADPGNSLGRLIAAASVSGLPPQTWLNVLRAFGLEGLRRGDAQPRYPDLLPVS